MGEKILCRAIVEIVGKPKEYVKKAVETVIEKAAEIKGLKIQKKEIAEIKSLKDEKLSKTEDKIQKKAGELFSTFTEIEFYADSIDVIASFCYDFLPSSLEIIEPEQITIDLQDVSRIFNDLLSKLQSADIAVKTFNMENNILKTNAALLLRNMIIVSLKSKLKNLEELSKAIGIPKDQLEPFLKKLIEENFLIKEEEIYKAKS